LTAIGKLKEEVTAITTAVEEQAPPPAQQTNQAIQEVSLIAEQTDTASGKVLSGAGDVGRNADTLRAEITQFLEAMTKAARSAVRAAFHGYRLPAAQLGVLQDGRINAAHRPLAFQHQREFAADMPLARGIEAGRG
jgi:hypothetical protein